MKNKLRESRDLNHAHLPCEELTVPVHHGIVTVYPFLFVGPLLSDMNHSWEWKFCLVCLEELHFIIEQKCQRNIKM